MRNLTMIALVLAGVFTLFGCGVSETYMKRQYSSLPIHKLCAKIESTDQNIFSSSSQKRWPREVLQERGEDCSGYRPGYEKDENGRWVAAVAGAAGNTLINIILRGLLF